MLLRRGRVKFNLDFEQNLQALQVRTDDISVVFYGVAGITWLTPASCAVKWQPFFCSSWTPGYHLSVFQSSTVECHLISLSLWELCKQQCRRQELAVLESRTAEWTGLDGKRRIASRSVSRPSELMNAARHRAPATSPHPSLHLPQESSLSLSTFKISAAFAAHSIASLTQEHLNRH